MSYELLSETKPVARKQYRCIWCPENILKGERHIHECSKYEGDFQDHRWHLECHKAASTFFSEYGEPDFPPRSFRRGTMEEA